MTSVENTTPAMDSSTASTAQEKAAGIANSVKSCKMQTSSTASALESVKNSDIANGPVATSVKNEAAATSSEMSNLAGARKMPEHTAANDTPLTHYHSFFGTLLSWQNPRATAIMFAASVVFILASRYVPLTRLLLKALWTSLGIVSLAEIISKTVIGSSVASSIRPRKYYRIPKESLEATLDDVEQLINFFVIEIQRIIFAESIPVTVAAFVATLLSYYLVKLMPTWGFLLFLDCIAFLAPLVYIQNKELIDGQIEHASNVIGEQTAQIKDITAQHTSKGIESVKAYTGDYASKASEYMGKSRQKIPMPATNGNTKSAASVKDADFPKAPQTDFPSATGTTEANPVGIPAS